MALDHADPTDAVDTDTDLTVSSTAGIDLQAEPAAFTDVTP